MEKLKSFRITALHMEGFKSYSQPTDLTFGDPTVITGGNGRGKSSIADAIAFAVTGLPFFGEHRIDRLHSEDNLDLFIRMRFVDENGTLHELSRARKSNRMTITYDGCEVRQVDLTDLFGERDVFLSIFNPLYFIEELGNDGKNLLQRYLPALTKEDILAQMAGPAVEALRDEPLLSPEVESRKLRETIRELENNVLYLTGQQDMTTAQQQNSKTALRELREKEDALRNEEQALKSKQFAGVDIAALNDELADLSARYSDLANQRQIPTASDECILALTQELTARKAAVYTPKYAETTAQVNARIRQLGSQYQQEKEQCSQLKPGYQCPTCRRAVTADELPAMQNAFRTSIKQIVEAGQAERAKLEELQALEKKARDTFLQFQKDDIAKLEETLQEAKEAAEPDATRPEAQQLQERMQALAAELEFGALSQEEYDRMFACREELRQVRADIAAIEKATPAASDLDSQLKAARAEIEQCKLKLQYLAQYISKRAEMTFSALKMNRVEISLYDVVKSTGEVKDAFKFTYNGRRYDWLSLSEKIRAGMEVSELMKRLTGRNYPQFVDNMESVDDLSNVRPTGQVIMAKCVSKAELSVRPVKPILTAMPTAA